MTVKLTRFGEIASSQDLGGGIISCGKLANPAGTKTGYLRKGGKVQVHNIYDDVRWEVLVREGTYPGVDIVRQGSQLLSIMPLPPKFRCFGPIYCWAEYQRVSKARFPDWHFECQISHFCHFFK